MPVESTVTDTLPLLESKIKTSTVERKDVDMLNFTKAWANSKMNSATLKLAVTQTPTTPSEPSTPSEPTTPSEPSTPSEPTTPSEPSTPSEPTTPSEPSTPSIPSEPSTPSEPTTPNEPSTPSEPATSDTSTTPADVTIPDASTTEGGDTNIDWGAVSASGINFAIIRAGYRGSSTGVLVEDPYFKRNIAGATKAGIKVGVYFFTQAITEAEAVEEASMALSLVSGYRLTYPIFIDTEAASNGRANDLSKSQRTAVVKAFCQTVQNGGYKAGIYASKSWFNNQLNASALSNYCIWVAQYSADCTYSGKYDMWQYTSKGSVSGIKGNVDMNISYTGY